MTDRPTRAIVETLEQSRDLMDASLRDARLVDSVAAAAAALTTALKGGGKLLVAGNGGSAADAQHIVGEIVGRFLYDRAPLAAVALTTDSSVMTAIGNDYGFDHIYARQVRGLGRPGDMFLGISTSGTSPSILQALDEARRIGMTTVGLTGAGGGRMAAASDILIRVPSERTFLIQQVHITIGHILCLMVEDAIFGGTR